MDCFLWREEREPIEGKSGGRKTDRLSTHNSSKLHVSRYATVPCDFVILYARLDDELFMVQHLRRTGRFGEYTFVGQGCQKLARQPLLRQLDT